MSDIITDQIGTHRFGEAEPVAELEHVRRAKEYQKRKQELVAQEGRAIAALRREQQIAFDRLTGEFNAAEYKDEYRDALMQVIESKIEGHEVKAPEPVEEGGKLIDLMAALEASVNAAKAARKGEEPVTVAEAKKARAGKAASAKAETKRRTAAKTDDEAEAEAAPAKPRKRKTA